VVVARHTHRQWLKPFAFSRSVGGRKISRRMKKKAAIHSELARCRDCNQLCCRYITVKIPAPRTICDFDGLLWQLAHENVKAFKDSTGWHLLIYNSCMHLEDSGECAIYEGRPITCREHSINSCEYDNSIEASSMNFFGSYEALDTYCRKKFKTWDRRF